MQLDLQDVPRSPFFLINEEAKRLDSVNIKRITICLQLGDVDAPLVCKGFPHPVQLTDETQSNSAKDSTRYTLDTLKPVEKRGVSFGSAGLVAC